MQRLDLLGVQAFISIAEAGSFNAGAHHLHISQTALTRRLQKLEAGLGLTLVERTTRSMTVTRAGMDFLPKAIRSVRELATALEDLRIKATQDSDEVVIGCLPTVAATRLAAIVREYGRRYPRNAIHVLDRSVTEIREAVLRGEVDFAISVLGSPHRDISSERLFSEPMVAACPLRHRFAGQVSLKWKELEGEPLIGIGALSGNRSLTEQVIASRRLKLRFAFEVQHLATAVGLVSGGAGIAVLPMSAVAVAQHKQLCVVPLEQPAMTRTIELFRRRDRPLSTAAAPLSAMVVRAFRGAEGKRAVNGGA
jgi:DNA-binding transcriptional LysR family regulator